MLDYTVQVMNGVGEKKSPEKISEESKIASEKWKGWSAIYIQTWLPFQYYTYSFGKKYYEEYRKYIFLCCKSHGNPGDDCVSYGLVY